MICFDPDPTEHHWTEEPPCERGEVIVLLRVCALALVGAAVYCALRFLGVL